MQEKLTVQEIEENNVINHWVEKYMDTKKEFDQYKKSKQASYEALQKQCNNLEFENRRIKGDNRILFEKVVEARKDAAEFADRFQRKTAECEELKNTLNKLTRGVVIPMQEPEVINLADHYHKALDEIKGICSQDRTISDVRLICSQSEKHRVKYDIQDKILDIISRAKGEVC